MHNIVIYNFTIKILKLMFYTYLISVLSLMLILREYVSIVKIVYCKIVHFVGYCVVNYCIIK
jgi:hypothetical protein